ncbi:MAG: PSD1 domain-containing protein [Bryobacterales bacterium]|nr:PSD1 domain-containing protein [Bryobacterales bacterium]
MRRLFLALGAIACSAFAQQPPAVALLEKRCVGCHSGASKQSGLDLSSRAMALRGGDRGPAIIPGKASDSLLYKVVTHAAKPHMPLQGAKLSDTEVEILASWINHDAPWQQPLPKAAATAPASSDHWAFQKPKRLDPPRPPNAAWVRNPIDAFVVVRHEKLKLSPVAEADKHTLIRRLYLDLIGVPPTPAEIGRFVSDSSSGAYETLVDSLLSDPRYGERWGRHWMDIWRYSDWYGWRRGNDVRNSHKFMWRWRDWIVESLNQDKPYDRMIVEMLAGDEVAPDDPSVVRATGFLARNFSKYDRHGWLQDAVDHTALGFLGVTAKCARCHDHKYDPISQEDYYRLRAYFEPYEVRIDRVRGQVDTDKDGLSRIFDAELDRPTYLLIRGDIQSPDKDRVLGPATPQALGGAPVKIEPVTLPLPAYYPDRRPFVHDDLRAQAKADLERAQAGLAKQQESYSTLERELAAGDLKSGFDKLRAAADQLALAQKTLAAAEAAIPALEARIAADVARYNDPPDPRYEELANTARSLERKAGILKAGENVFRAQLEFQQVLASEKADEKKVGEAQKKLAVAQAALTQVPEGYTQVGKVYPTKSTGRRTALARWIGSPENPLTARVAVNHIWLRHFGAALVPTVFDFGRNGKPPSHPELLDWLATEFMRSGWSMKAIHRLIVTSNTYRMRSTAGQANHPNLAADPENRFYWRMNPRRMEAEVVRDSVLHVAGRLDFTMGGPEIDETKGFESMRRSIYFSHSPDTQMEFLKMFDAPNPVECYMRNESVVPQQALAMANSAIAQQQAQTIAKRLDAQAPDSAAFVGLAFETILGRPPDSQERSAAQRFLARQPELIASLKPAPDSGLRARANFIHVLLNHNDFLTIR